MTGFLQKLLLLFVLKPEKLIEALNYARFHFLRRLLRTITRELALTLALTLVVAPGGNKTSSAVKLLWHLKV